jgi:hypothetical protein
MVTFGGSGIDGAKRKIYQNSWLFYRTRAVAVNNTRATEWPLPLK